MSQGRSPGLVVMEGAHVWEVVSLNPIPVYLMDLLPHLFVLKLFENTKIKRKKRPGWPCPGGFVCTIHPTALVRLPSTSFTIFHSPLRIYAQKYLTNTYKQCFFKNAFPENDRQSNLPITFNKNYSDSRWPCESNKQQPMSCCYQIGPLLATLFLKNGPIPASFSFIFGLFIQPIQFFHQINVKNVHPVYSTGIQTHNHSNMSRHP